MVAYLIPFPLVQNCQQILARRSSVALGWSDYNPNPYPYIFTDGY